MRIDPWGSEAYDYDRLREEFGIEPLTELAERMPPNRLIDRGIVFGHRGMDRVVRAMEAGDPWALMTGLMPSGPMHLGHKMVIDQILYYQDQGADVFIGVADVEAYATRGQSIEECRRLAVEEYLTNYIALGLEPDDCQVYFQSKRETVKDLAWRFGAKINWSEMESIYGFEGSTNMGHVVSPLIQVGDILHVQLEAYGGPRPTVVPVGVDQDPHIRLTRDVASRFRTYSVKPAEEGGLGVFVKTDDEVEAWIDAAEDALADTFGELERNVPYKALYVRDADPADLPVVDALVGAVEADRGGTGFVPPASTYHAFMPGLTGGKMSSSEPKTAIFLRDDWEDVEAKVKQAKTNGLPTAEEQREKGAEPIGCVIYEHFRNHFAEDDDELQMVYDECRSGARLCGECKQHLLGNMETFHEDHQAKLDEAEDRVDEYLRED